FFFQAEDGIRDRNVTGVQTCALPISETNPIRIELFDDEIDSIRYFDANNQRSLENAEKVGIVPARELLVTKEDMMRAANQLDKRLQAVLKRMKASPEKDALVEAVEYDIDLLRTTEKFQEMYKYSELFYEQTYSLLDYLDKDSLIMIDDFN